MKYWVINPKGQPLNELYGVMDPGTRDWTDGILSNIFRELNQPLPKGKEQMRWIIYDGDVDAVWVENMNSVMDDNRLLTPPGERIRCTHCAMICETFDLQYAARDDLALRHGVGRPEEPRLPHVLRALGAPALRRRLHGRARERGRGGAVHRAFDQYVKKLIDYVLFVSSTA